MSWRFRHVEKPLDWKAKVNFKIYDVAIWLTNNFNAHIGQYLKKQRQLDNEIWPVKEYNMSKTHAQNVVEKLYFQVFF